MKASKNTVPVLEIILLESNTGGDNKYLVKLNGKPLHPEIYKCTFGNIKLYLEPEEFLDFKGTFLPTGYRFEFQFETPRCGGLLCCMSISGTGSKVLFSYNLVADFEDFPKTILNPYLLLERLKDLATKEKLKNYFLKEDASLDISFEVLLNCNLATHCKRHLAQLEKMIKKVEDKMVKEFMDDRK